MKPAIKKKFKKELRRQSRLAIAAAIGFLIAFSWRDTIFLLIEKYVRQLTSMTGLFQIKIASSLIITLVGVLLILLSSRLLE